MLCEGCEHPLNEIDHYGERLNGCLQCNCWKIDKRAVTVPHDKVTAISMARRMGVTPGRT